MGLQVKRKQRRRNTVKVPVGQPDEVRRQVPRGDGRCYVRGTSVLSQRSQRIGIAFFYIHALGSPPRSEWSGKAGTVAKIRSTFNIPIGSRFTICRVLTQVQLSNSTGKQYDGRPTAPPRPRSRVIKVGSMEAQLVADAMEQCEIHI
jgi:hypothetical protein